MNVVTKRTVAAVVVGLAAFAFYLTAFHGERWSFKAHDGSKYYTSRQYFFSWMISEKQWSDPKNAPNPPAGGVVVGPSQDWRGFGILWKNTRHWEGP